MGSLVHRNLQGNRVACKAENSQIEMEREIQFAHLPSPRTIESLYS